MNTQYKSKKGDISILVTLLVCSIILVLLAPIAQKLTVEARISKENLMSQQAIQAAKTGLDHWLQRWVGNEEEELLDGKINEQITYKVTSRRDDSAFKLIITSTATVTVGSTKVERSLEQTFE
jgi:cytoskeletal protein RodZ